MKSTTLIVLNLLLLVLGLSTASRAEETRIEIFYTGLYNPKDIEFDDQGYVYVAESGKPGNVIIPLPAQYGRKGPIGSGGRISRISPDGKTREDWITGLPNLGIYSGSEILGPSGMAKLNGRLYMVQAAHLVESPYLNEILPNKTLRKIVDVGAFNKKWLAAEDNGDAVPTGNPYDLIDWQGALFISDGNFNRILKATPEGSLDIFAKSPRQTTTTGMAIGPDGYLYVTQFGNAPYYAGSGRVDRVSPKGEWESGIVKTLQNPLSVAFDSKGTMYVLQFASLFSPARLKYLPYGGKILRVNPDHTTTPVVTDLTYPTFMKFDAHDTLWVVNYGNQASKGEGQLLKIKLGEGLARGPRIVPPADAPTVEVLKAEAIAREKLAAMNMKEAQKKGTVIRIVEGPDTQKWGYDPPLSKARPGEVVTIINGGKMPHSATSLKGNFDTGLIPAGETQVIQVREAGEYDFLCTPHPWMKGKLVVAGEPMAGAPVLAKAFNDAPPPGDAQGGLVNPRALVGLFVTLILMTLGVAALMRKKDGE